MEVHVITPEEGKEIDQSWLDFSKFCEKQVKKQENSNQEQLEFEPEEEGNEGSQENQIDSVKKKHQEWVRKLKEKHQREKEDLSTRHQREKEQLKYQKDEDK